MSNFGCGYVSGARPGCNPLFLLPFYCEGVDRYSNCVVGKTDK